MSDGIELLRKCGVIVFWGGALAGSVAYAWLQLRATVLEGGSPAPDERGRRRFQTPEARALSRRARLFSVLGVLSAIAAIALMALKRRGA